MGLVEEVYQVRMSGAIDTEIEPPGTDLDHLLESLSTELLSVYATSEKYRHELELERMRVATCIAIADADDPEKAPAARNTHIEFMSELAIKVAALVDHKIKSADMLAYVKATLEEIDEPIRTAQGYHEMLHILRNDLIAEF